MRECPKNKQGGGNAGNRAQFSSIDPLEKVAPRGANSGTCRGADHLYELSIRQEKDNSLYVVTSMKKVFMFDVFSFLHLVGSLFFNSLCCELV